MRASGTAKSTAAWLPRGPRSPFQNLHLELIRQFHLQQVGPRVGTSSKYRWVPSVTGTLECPLLSDGTARPTTTVREHRQAMLHAL